MAAPQRAETQQPGTEAHITVDNLTMAYGDFVVQRDVHFVIPRGQIFIIMGDSGCGKSTLLRHMIGLKRPAKGDVLFGEQSMWTTGVEERDRMTRKFGVLYQSGALFSSMTLSSLRPVLLRLAAFTRSTTTGIPASLPTLSVALSTLSRTEAPFSLKRAAFARNIKCGKSIFHSCGGT